MNALMRALLELTRIDRKLVRCRKRVLAGPKEIAEHETKLKDQEKAFEAIRAAVRVQAIDGDRHALDAHTAAAEIAQIQKRLLAVKNNTEYTHLNDRLRDLREVIDREESAVLNGMEAIDRLRVQEKEQAAKLENAKKALADLKADVVREAEAIQGEQRDLRGKRDVALSRVAEADAFGSATGAYNAAVQRTRGDAMGQMADNVCQSCFRTQNPNVLDAILLGVDPAAMTCPGCGRILYLNTDADPED